MKSWNEHFNSETTYDHCENCSSDDDFPIAEAKEHPRIMRRVAAGEVI